MPPLKGAKKALKRGFKNAKKELGPIVKTIAREAVRAAKAEAKSQGLGLVQRGLKNVFGSGDYRTNSLIKGGMNSSPSFGPPTSTFRRRECLGSITTSPTARDFQIQKFRVNPGLASTFPWLSGIANNYESYRPRSMIFEYIPTSGMSVSSGDTSLGSVTMAAQYNPFASDPTSLVQIQGYNNAVAFAPYENAAAGVECLANKRQADTLLIRNANVAGVTLNTGYDTLFDLCEFFIATDGFQAASVVIGQLWVTYEIILSNPIVPISLPFNTGFQISASTTTNSATNLFASAYSLKQWGSDQSVVPATNTITIPNFPVGRYWIELFVVWGAAITNPNPQIGLNSGPWNSVESLGAPQASLVNVTNYWGAVVADVIKSQDSMSIVLSQLGSPSNIVRYDIIVTRVPDTFLPL
jgi:hypothetical protein